MTDQELSLNGPERFRKRSPRLTLEEHGSCEVPAGCGGVVLRWIRKGGERARVHLTLLWPAPVQAWLDGELLATGAIELAPGGHVLAAELSPRDLGGSSLVAQVMAIGAGRWRLELHSAADGSWRGTSTPPLDDGWRLAAFDDSSWAPLEARPRAPRPRAASPVDDAQRRAWLEDRGAVPLGLPGAVKGAPSGLWVRLRWALPPPPPPRGEED